MSTDWSEVYRSNYQAVVRFLHRKVWDEERARDLAQESFARALGSDPDDPRAWVFRIAGNLARDEARLVVRRKRHLSLLKVEASAEEGASATPDAELDRKEAAEQVREALNRLGERDRELLLLWDAGLSYEEIAARLELARGAVGTTLARAKQRLVDAHGALEDRDAALG
ncbi:MAG: sigma-70 family RNA polymerase sigma factor [Gemmatimonadota bacterium]